MRIISDLKQHGKVTKGRQKRNNILLKKEIRHLSWYKLFWYIQRKRGWLGNEIVTNSKKNKK